MKNKLYIEKALELRLLVENKDYNSILSCLNKFSLPQDFSLKVRLCSEHANHCSFLYVWRDDFELRKNAYLESELEKIFNYLKVEDSCMGAWQVYLIDTLWHILPLYWHGLYNERKYIYTEQDYRSLCGSQGYLGNINYEPKIELMKVGTYYEVSACYWTYYGGLIREHVIIHIKNNMVQKIEKLDDEVLYKYECNVSL